MAKTNKEIYNTMVKEITFKLEMYFISNAKYQLVLDIGTGKQIERYYDMRSHNYTETQGMIHAYEILLNSLDIKNRIPIDELTSKAKKSYLDIFDDEYRQRFEDRINEEQNKKAV
jgi:hypothetical protein